MAKTILSDEEVQRLSSGRAILSDDEVNRLSASPPTVLSDEEVARLSTPSTIPPAQPAYAIPPVEAPTFAMPSLRDVGEEYKAAGLSALRLGTDVAAGVSNFGNTVNANLLELMPFDFAQDLAGRLRQTTGQVEGLRQQVNRDYLTPNVVADPLSEVGGKIAAGAVPTTAALMAGAPALAVGGIGAVTGLGQGYSTAKDYGASDEQAAVSGLANALINTSDAALGGGVSRTLNPLIQAGLAAGRGAAINAGQEVLSNLEAAYLSGYDPNRPVLENVVPAAIIGGSTTLAGNAPRIGAGAQPPAPRPEIEPPPPLPPMSPEAQAQLRAVRTEGEPIQPPPPSITPPPVRPAAQVEPTPTQTPRTPPEAVQPPPLADTAPPPRTETATPGTALGSTPPPAGEGVVAPRQATPPETPMMSGPGNPEDIDAAIAKVGDETKPAASDFYDAVARGTKRFSNYLRTKAPRAGKVLADAMDAIGDRARPAIGVQTVELADAIGNAPLKTRKNAMMWMNGRLANATPEEQRIGTQVRATLDRLLERAKQIGVKRKVRGEWVNIEGSGEAYPEMPNKAGLAKIEAAIARPDSPETRAFVQELSGYNKTTSDEVMADLTKWRDRLRRGMNPYLESTRIKLPDEYIEFDPLQTLPRFIETQNVRIEQMAEWGPDAEMPKLTAALGRLRDEAGPDAYNYAKRFLDFETGVESPAGVPGTNIAGKVSTYQTISKLTSPLSALRNSFQPYTNPNISFKNKVKATAQMLPFAWKWTAAGKALKRQIDKSGAVRAHTILTDVDPSPSTLVNKAMTLHTAAESRNQYLTSLMASLEAQDHMKNIMRSRPNSPLAKGIERLLGWDAATARGQLAKFGVDDARIEKAINEGGKLSIDDINLLRQRMVRDTQFPLEMATRRGWWNSNPWMRTIGKFKTFSLEQTGMMYRDVYKEALRGNAAPLSRFLVSTMIVGELYNLARDAALGSNNSLTSLATGDDDKTVRETAKRMAENIVDGGGVGILADMVYGIDNAVGGPTQNTLSNIGTTLAKIAQRPSADVAKGATWNLIKREVPLINQATSATGPWERISRYLRRDKETASAIDYAEVRNNARDFSQKQKAPPLGAKDLVDTGVRVLLGQQTFLPGPNTQLYQSATGQIASGNTDKASDTIANILRDAVDENGRVDSEKMKRLTSDIRTAMMERGPLGPLNKDQIPKYLASLPQEKRNRANFLQRKWGATVQESIGKAIKKARQ